MTRLAVLAALLLCGIGCGKTGLFSPPAGSADGDVDTDTDANSDGDSDTDDAFCSEYAGSQFFLEFEGPISDTVTHGCGFLVIEDSDIWQDEKLVEHSTLHFISGNGEIEKSYLLEINARRLHWAPLIIENEILLVSGGTGEGSARIDSLNPGNGEVAWSHTSDELYSFGAFAILPGFVRAISGTGPSDDSRIVFVAGTFETIPDFHVPLLFQPELDGYAEQQNVSFRNVAWIAEDSIALCGLGVATGTTMGEEPLPPEQFSFVARIDGYEELAWSTATLHEADRFFDCTVRDAGESQPVILATGESTAFGVNLALFQLSDDGQVGETLDYWVEGLESRGFSVRVDGEGVVVGGVAWEPGDTWDDSQPLIARIDDSHELEWHRLFDFTGGVDVALPAEGGGYVASGWMTGQGPEENNDGFLVRTDEQGYY